MVKSTQIVGDIDFEMTKDIKPIYNGTWGQSANGKSYKEVYAMVEELCDIETEKRIYKTPPIKRGLGMKNMDLNRHYIIVIEPYSSLPNSPIIA